MPRERAGRAGGAGNETPPSAYQAAMRLWNTRPARRALVVLVLLLGQVAAMAAARPGCAHAHDAAATRASVAAAATARAAAVAERPAAASHDHAPGTPSAPGATSCTTLLAAVPPRQETTFSAGPAIAIAPAEGSRPTSVSAPPPYRPPRA